MTNYEHIFFDPAPLVSCADIAQLLSDRLDMRYVANDHGHLIGWEWVDEDGPHVLGGDIAENIFGDNDPDHPEEFSIFDALPVVWSLTQRPARDVDEPRRAALSLFRQLVDVGFGWPMVLVTGFDRLVAAYDTGRGLRVFPEHTSPDEDGVEVWR